MSAVAEKVRVAVVLPTMLVGCTEGKRKVEVEGATLGECIDDLVVRYPLLEVHLFVEGRELRQHVNLFHNETNVKWLEEWGVPVGEGDRLTVIQAVSGG